MLNVLKGLIHPFYFYLLISFRKYKILFSDNSIKLKGRVNIFGSKLGKHVYIENSKVLNTIIGNHSYLANNGYLNNCKIGNYCCIGPNVSVGLGEHPSEIFVSIHPVFYTKTSHLGYTFDDTKYFKEYSSTEIGNDVWIGSNVIIKGGVKIGNGAIIASGAVVTKDVLDYSIVGGVPAKHIKSRFEADEISFLKDFKWWDKDFVFLKNHQQLFHNIRNLMEFFENN